MKRMLWMFVMTIGVSCGADEEIPPPPSDAGLMGRDGATACVLGNLDGDPMIRCVAQWACPNDEAFTLACGDAGSGAIKCACARNEDDPVLVDAVPTSCTDPVIVTAFAREHCGWSLQ